MKNAHSAVWLEFTNRSNKFKTTFFRKPVIDWKSIKEKDEVDKKFNVNLINCLKIACNYTKFNDTILRSGEETYMMKNSEDQGWYHFNRNTLTPTLEYKNSVLHDIQADKNTPSPRTLRHLKTLKHKVNEAVSVATLRLTCHLAEDIHSMTFNPKEAWSSIGRLTGGESIHNASPKVIHMRLPSGNSCREWRRKR